MQHMSHYLTGPIETLSPGHWVTTVGAGTPTHGSTFYYPSAYQYSECWGHRTPNFYRLLSEGALIPYSAWVKTTMSGDCSGVYQKQRTAPFYRSEISGFAGYRNWYADFPGIHSALFNEAKNFSLVQKCAANAYTKGFDLGTFMAEAGKAAKMVRDVSKQLTNFAVKYTSPGEVKGFLQYWGSPHGKKDIARALKNPATLIRCISEAWLQGRFGWRPLVNDLADLNGVIIDFDGYKTRYRTSSSKQLSDNPSPSVTTINEGEYTGTVTVTNACSLSMRGSLVADIVPSKYRMDLAATAWELVPYSFVVDWIYDVGTAIEALGFLQLAHAYTAADGYQINCEQTYSYQSSAWISGWSGEVSQTATFRAVYRARRPTPVPWLPQQTFKIDGLKCLDAIALVYQLFHKGGQKPKYWNGKPLVLDLNDL